MGVDSRIVQVAATRLNERRLAVLEECVELELRLGRHRDLSGSWAALLRSTRCASGFGLS